MTNGEYIRGLSNEEFAHFMSRLIDCETCPAMDHCHNSNDSCANCLAVWLNKERTGKHGNT